MTNPKTAKLAFLSAILIYGTLGAVIVLLLWLYLASVMLIMGAEFNSVLMVLRKQHTAEAEENLGETQK